MDAKEGDLILENTWGKGIRNIWWNLMSHGGFGVSSGVEDGCRDVKENEKQGRS